MLDMKTILLNYALIHAIGLIGMAALWRQNRKELSGIKYFLASYAVQFAANFFVFLRGIAPDFVTIVLANGMYFSGVILLYVGLTHFVYRPISQAHNYVMLAVCVLFDSFFTFVVPSLTARNIVASLGLFFVYSQCAWLVFFKVDKNRRHIVTHRLGYIFSAYCLLVIAHIIGDIVFPPGNALFRSGRVDALFLAIHQTLFILLTFSLFLINNRKLIADLKDDITRRERDEAEIARLATVIEQAAVTVIITDLEGAIVYANPAFEITTGYTVTEALGKNPSILKSSCQEASLSRQMWETITTGSIWNGVFINKRKDGSLYHEQASVFPIKNASGDIINYAAIKRDITDQVQVEQALIASEERYRLLFENASDLVYSVAPDGSFVFANPAWKKTLGYSDEEITNLSFLDIINPDEHEHCREIFRKVLSGKSFDQLRTKFISKNGNEIVVEGSISSKLSAGRTVASMCFFRDISERVQAEQRLQHTATHDPLTDLPNRTLFFDRLSQAMAKAKRNKEQLAVLFIDLDAFKAVNDTYGHHIGDQMLIAFTGRLNKLFRKSDTVARLSGDEFALMLESLSKPKDAARIAKKIMSFCSKPYKLENNDVLVTLSIGISIYPEDATDAGTLLQKADAAMYQIKQQGKNSYLFFDETGNRVTLG